MAESSGAITPAKRCLSPTAVVIHHGAMEDTVHDGGTTEVVVLEPQVHDGALEPRRKSILRFPPNLRRIAEDKDYVAPRTVALGPYYHGRPELQEMEEVKNMAVGFFFQGFAPGSRESSYKDMVPIARQARGSYADAAGITTDDDEFATMMFVDGCFLVQFIDTMLRVGKEETAASQLRRMMQPHLLGIMRDMVLLENQIPWPVMQFFMTLNKMQMKEIVAVLVSWGLEGRVWRDPYGPLVEVTDERCPPPSSPPSHLLGLIRFYKVGSGGGGGGGKRNEERGFSGKATRISTSAAELAAMGIKLRASKKTTKLSNMNLMKHTLCAKLSLPPLYIDSIVANWLVNMAAFEMCTEASSTDEYSINSYLSVLSLLMNQENDVRELRVKHIVHGFFGDQETLEFFKRITPLLYLRGQTYLRIIGDLQAYRDNRRLWIAVYSFLYNQKKTIMAVLSIVGVLVPIFKALFSLKKHQM